MGLPLISVVIPTCNSAHVLGDCLLSIRKQDYPQDRIEILVVDCFSKDGTSAIAKSFGARIFFSRCGMLGAKKIGFEKSMGDLILFLDSDQMLKTRDCLKRAAAMSQEYDIFHFEEFSLPPTTWLQLLMKLDKEITQEVSYDLNPIEGVLYPRFFKREILDKAFRSIPTEIIRYISEHEDVVLHWETYKVSGKVGTVKDAVWHRDPQSLLVFWKKMYRYGKNSNVVRGWYDRPVSYKQAFRIKQIIHLLKQPWKAALVDFLLMLKMVPYKLGQIVGVLTWTRRVKGTKFTHIEDKITRPPRSRLREHILERNIKVNDKMRLLMDRIINGGILSKILRFYPVGRIAFKISVLLKRIFLFAGIWSQRAIEYPWVLKNLPKKSNVLLLDVGCAESLLSHEFVAKGYRVIGIDIRSYPWKIPQMFFYKMDIVNTAFPSNLFDIIVMVSTVEHVGMKAYGQFNVDQNADLKAIKELRRILKIGGFLLLTTPYVGPDHIRTTPNERQYNEHRLNELIDGLHIIKEDYFYPIRIKKRLRWMSFPKEKMRDLNSEEPGIACLLLVKSNRI